MSQAKVHRAAKARKEWKCGRCGDIVKVGEPVLSFSVGFRGREQRRCDKRECYPTREERESSMVSAVYGALDNADWRQAESAEDLKMIMNDIAAVMREVAGEYEGSEMFGRNEDLQERAELLNSAANDLENWEPDEQEPDSESPETWDDYETFVDAREAWLADTRQEAEEYAEGVEIP